MFRAIFRSFALTIGVFFLLPMTFAAAWWSQVDRPANWRSADWNSSGILPEATESDEASVYVMAARTGGFKGAFSVHSWIVLEEEGSDTYTRYDKVGWGSPIRVNAYAADANWYSNRPEIVKALHGDAAKAAIPTIKAAIGTYAFNQRGDYQIWPGPNSNSFVAHVLRQTPEIGAVLPPNAVGRDYLGDGTWFSIDPDGRDLHVSLAGYAGFSAGVRSGFELHVLGQTVGIDVMRPALKIPGIGRIGVAL